MEYLDVVNDKDKVVGEVSRKELYKKLLTHRIVHVLIFNEKGELALQMRSDKMSYCPQHWPTSAGGHVQKGESYSQAARRELMEECGIDTEIEFMFKDKYIHKDSITKFLSIFKTLYDRSLSMKNEEVEKQEFFSISEIKDMITRGEKMHPELTFIIDNHF
ncbi:NUDIX domain-containing protein [Patescibacteria group bacterium]|nr:NUDIX domain-containing protein [Patescibacteria group bacterium]MBU1075488.1 NUDIX domain-containing protein [Patescibacteria group bacterium]